MRIVNPQKGDIVTLVFSSSQVKYDKQSDIHIGDLIWAFEGETILSHKVEVLDVPRKPMCTFMVVKIEYNSRLHKFFRKFISEPIKTITIECRG